MFIVVHLVFLVSLLHRILFKYLLALSFDVVNCFVLLPSGASNTPSVRRASFGSSLVIVCSACD
jgi:hypothetical protein